MVLEVPTDADAFLIFETLNDRGRELMDRMFSRYAEAVLDLESAEFLP